MNEAGVLGRFIPDFGRIVSMMQFNMYHHYTVDEHLLRSVDILSRIDRGEDEEIHPLAVKLMPAVEDRTALYVAVLLHDVAKGRPEDHSVAGARLARRLCARFRLTPKQIDTVAWLIEEHLTMSMVAQTRDLNDRKTILDFAERVQSLERLKMLMILTDCDIRAVGPGVWTAGRASCCGRCITIPSCCSPVAFPTCRARRGGACCRHAVRALGDFSQRTARPIRGCNTSPISCRCRWKTSSPCALHSRNGQGRQDAGDHGAHAPVPRDHRDHRAGARPSAPACDHRRRLCGGRRQHRRRADLHDHRRRALDTILINREFPVDDDELRRRPASAG